MQKSKAYLDLDLDGIRLFLKIDDYVNCANKNDSIYDYLCYTEMYFDFEKSHIRLLNDIMMIFSKPENEEKLWEQEDIGEVKDMLYQLLQEEQ